MTLENVYAVRDDTTNRQARVKVITKLSTKTLNFTLDTGADMTVVPNLYFRKNSPLIQPVNKRLYGPGHHEIKVIGSWEATLSTLATEIANSLENLFIVENLKELLLREPTIKALSLLKVVNTVKTEGHQYKKEFSELLTGLRKLEHVYQTRLDAGVHLFFIATRRRLP